MTHPRSSVYAPRGACATSQPLAAAAGARILARGGNAVDAAIAAAAALTVVQPGSNDIGGDLFAIVWDGQRLHGLNASGRAPAALTREALLAAGPAAAATDAHGGAQADAGAYGAVPPHGWAPVTVPGAPAGWRDLHGRFGQLPFAELFQDAVSYAEQGYPVSPRVAASWQQGVARYRQLAGQGPEFAEWGRVWTIDGEAPRAGARWRNPAGAGTLRLIADSRAEAFYQGEIADAMVAAAAGTGGYLGAADLAEHTSSWVDPISVEFAGHRVWELPPNGQGIAALQALGILGRLDLAGADEQERWHAEIEAIKLGFADAHAYVADPDRVAVPVAGMLDPAYLAQRARLVGPKAADPPPGDPARGGTVYLCTADADGLMVSLIQSNYQGFGSYVAVPGYGFGLQNRGAGFSLDPRHPNVLAPGKRPFHTIIPGFLTRADGAPVGPFGVMGGHMQPQGHVQLVTRTLLDGLDPQSALAAPRWYWHAGRRVYAEPTTAAEVLTGLRQRDHDLVSDAGAAFFGHGQAIWRLPEGGYQAGSEPRADGCAIGW
ncbi:gamma-glutamyltransferase family protein [Natronosporangium hydrolyticum]|uniref:Gamma-glutamyltransferase family protein n=1 Tax=Natronosporangium hydrolyticum TaxID=2811111 RepID=A0A895YGK9_9ACTN|nr:gamma-glutamyltransferase family protein [Natronosporangium hydrolyticum]QSB14533.1 gamma-glutamyltransferase family protein [Natronosporangium hydrolyticum]